MTKFKEYEGMTETDGVIESETEEILYDDEEWIEGSSETDDFDEMSEYDEIEGFSETEDEIKELPEELLDETDGGSGISTTSKTYSQRTLSTTGKSATTSVASIMNYIDKVMLWSNSTVPTSASKNTRFRTVTISRTDMSKTGVVYYRIWGHVKGEKTYTRNIVIKVKFLANALYSI